MKATLTGALATALLCLQAAPAPAQSESLETVMVTSSRISYRDLLETPAVSITRPGDYLLLALTMDMNTAPRVTQFRPSLVSTSSKASLPRSQPPARAANRTSHCGGIC